MDSKTPERHKHPQPSDRCHDERAWQLIDKLLALIRHMVDKGCQPGAHFNVAFGPAKLKRRNTMIVNQQIFNTQEIDVTLTPDAPLDGAIDWEVIEGNSTLVPVEGNTDGTKMTLRSEDGIGRTRFKATGDADLGAGFVEVSVEIDLDVIGPQAQTLAAEFGAARTKTPTP